MDKESRSRVVKEIRLVMSGSTKYNVRHTDKLLDKIISDVYDLGYCDATDDNGMLACESGEPLFNEGYD